MCDQQILRSACAYAQSDQSLCLSLEYPMSVRLLTEHHLAPLSLKGGCTRVYTCQNATLLENICHSSYNLHTLDSTIDKQVQRNGDPEESRYAFIKSVTIFFLIFRLHLFLFAPDTLPYFATKYE